MPQTCTHGVRSPGSGNEYGPAVEFHESRIGDRLALNALGLVTALVRELLAEKSGPEVSDTASPRSETLTRIKEFAEANLMDPDLSPESIALAHRISVRCLHQLLAERRCDGEPVGAAAKARRQSARAGSGVEPEADRGGCGAPVGFHQPVALQPGVPRRLR